MSRPCRDLPDTPDRRGVVDPEPRREGVDARRMPRLELDELEYVDVANGAVISGADDGERLRALCNEYDINLNQAR